MGAVLLQMIKSSLGFFLRYEFDKHEVFIAIFLFVLDKSYFYDVESYELVYNFRVVF